MSETAFNYEVPEYPFGADSGAAEPGADQPDETVGTGETTEAAEGSSSSTASAAYMSFTGFTNLLKRLRTEGVVPQIVDKSFLGNRSGSLVSQIRGTLRFLGLIDEAYRPTPLLRELVAAPTEEELKEVLRRITEDRYVDALALGAGGTHDQLLKVFRSMGLNGETTQKAAGFYLGLAEYVGIETSPYFKRGRPAGGNGGGSSPRRNRKKVTKTEPEPSETTVQEAKPLDPDAALEADRVAYRQALLGMVSKKAESGELSADDTLLDRMERLLGYEAQSKNPSEAGEAKDG